MSFKEYEELPLEERQKLRPHTLFHKLILGVVDQPLDGITEYLS